MIPLEKRRDHEGTGGEAGDKGSVSPKARSRSRDEGLGSAVRRETQEQHMPTEENQTEENQSDESQSDESQSDESQTEESLGTESEIEELGGCRRRMKALVPVAKVREELDRNYRDLAQTVQIPGFRKGRVPRRLLESRYGDDIKSEVKESIVATSFSEVVEERELQVFSSPKFDNVTFENDADLTYEAEFEVRPEFELTSYKAIEVTRDSVEFDEADIDAELQKIRKQLGELEPAGSGDVGADGYVNASYTLLVDGNEVKRVDKATFQPGSNVLDQFYIEDLADKLAAGDMTSETPFSFDVKIPAHYPDEVLRGKEAKLELAVKEALRLKLPDLDDEFARAAQYESLDELKAEIVKTLKQRKEREVERRMEESILETLVAATEIEVPETLVETQLRRNRMDKEQVLLEQGYTREQVEEFFAKEAAADQADGAGEDGKTEETGGDENGDNSTAEIRQHAKKFFILEAVAEKEKIFATEQNVEDRSAQMAHHYGMSPEKFRVELERGERLNELRQSLKHEKVREFLRKAAKITNLETTSESEADVSDDEGGEESPDET